MTDTEYAKAIQMRATVANLEMNAALTIEQQAQIGQDFIADIAELSERGTGSETNDD
ncbi:prophage P1 protein 32 [Lactiplantibacillus plantarum]|nr:prophage P1 protein 32 [Lactiplantibacillus plantarum]MCG0864855.1 prophage P1 protein 32 [Lactiplantibacillus plantarum]